MQKFRNLRQNGRNLWRKKFYGIGPRGLNKLAKSLLLGPQNIFWNGSSQTCLKVVRIEEDGIGDVQLSGYDVGNDVRQSQDVVVVAVRVPVGAQLLVVQLWALVLDGDVVYHLKIHLDWFLHNRPVVDVITISFWRKSRFPQN